MGGGWFRCDFYGFQFGGFLGFIQPFSLRGRKVYRLIPSISWICECERYVEKTLKDHRMKKSKSLDTFLEEMQELHG